MIIGSSSGWLMLAGMMARPRATSLAHQLDRHAFAQGDELHLRGDLAAAGVVELGDGAAAAEGGRAEGRDGGTIRLDRIGAQSHHPLQRLALPPCRHTAVPPTPHLVGRSKPPAPPAVRRRTRTPAARWCRTPGAAAPRPRARSRAWGRGSRAARGHRPWSNWGTPTRRTARRGAAERDGGMQWRSSKAPEKATGATRTRSFAARRAPFAGISRIRFQGYDLNRANRPDAPGGIRSLYPSDRDATAAHSRRPAMILQIRRTPAPSPAERALRLTTRPPGASVTV